MSITEKLVTAAEFGEMIDDRRTELVRGRIIELTPPKPKHGRVVFAIARIVGGFIEDHDLGRWFGESGIITERGPDSVRAPDAAFISFARLPRDADDSQYSPVSPDLVFEVFSQSDRWVNVLDKVAEYLRAGTTAVCVVVPSTRTVQIHRADSAGLTLAELDVFDLPDILPGFHCQVADFFPR